MGAFPMQLSLVPCSGWSQLVAEGRESGTDMDMFCGIRLVEYGVHADIYPQKGRWPRSWALGVPDLPNNFFFDSPRPELCPRINACVCVCVCVEAGKPIDCPPFLPSFLPPHLIYLTPTRNHTLLLPTHYRTPPSPYLLHTLRTIQLHSKSRSFNFDWTGDRSSIPTILLLYVFVLNYLPFSILLLDTRYSILDSRPTTSTGWATFSPLHPQLRTIPEPQIHALVSRLPPPAPIDSVRVAVLPQLPASCALCYILATINTGTPFRDTIAPSCRRPPWLHRLTRVPRAHH